MRERALTVNGCQLIIDEVGDPTAPALVLLHGMRDIAANLMPIAEQLACRFRVFVPDQRGHGRSDRAESYSIHDYLYDLHVLQRELIGVPALLAGHSLGGQIVSRYAATFPDQVRAAVIIEGTGPPSRPGWDDPVQQIRGYREQLLRTWALSADPRPLPNLEFAAHRLQLNNPRLSESMAQRIAQNTTRRNAGGDLEWMFDPRVQRIFTGFSEADSQRYWRTVQCPVLLVYGDLAYEHWRTLVAPGEDWDGQFKPGELEQRIEAFARRSVHHFENAGHMVHYDEPDALARLMLDFLEEHQ